MAPEVHSLGHVGLERVAADDDTVYLRAVDEFAHHSVSLTEARSAGISSDSR